nr:MAG TPA: intron associated endonuclease [Caudoviricetes sp.]
MCGIYKITNLISKKVYIGQSVDINYRFNNHKSESFNPKSNAYNTYA